MWNYIWPVLLIVASNTVYQICAKSTPSGVQPMVSLMVTYLIAAALSLALFFAGGERHLAQELRKVNWTGLVLGAAIVGLELGSICMYRAGWKISVGSLVANVGVACVLLLIGFLLYRESITLKQIAGVGLCVAGLFLISK